MPAVACAPGATARLAHALAVIDAHDDGGCVDLGALAPELALSITDATLPNEAFFLTRTGQTITLAPDAVVLVCERVAVTAHLRRYARLIGELGWRLGREIAAIGALID